MKKTSIVVGAVALAAAAGGYSLLSNDISARNEDRPSNPVAQSAPGAQIALENSMKNDDKPAEPAQMAQADTPNIVEIVLADDGEFDVLQAAVVKAGLADTLATGGPFTVFAPTDQAFVDTLGVADEAAAIAAVEALPEEDLTNILLYHVLNGKRYSQSVLGAQQYNMLNDMHLTKAELQDAGIADTDIEAENGVIHVINSVLMPS